MTKSLILVRHAESHASSPGTKELERNLTNAGIRDACKIGKYFLNNHIHPETIYASHASRAIQTAQLILEQAEMDSSRIHMREDLYEASVRILMKTIKETDDRYKEILIIGHNPSLTFLGEYLTEKSIGRIVPAGFCILEFQLDSWNSIEKGSGLLKVLKSPSEIILT